MNVKLIEGQFVGFWVLCKQISQHKNKQSLDTATDLLQ